MSIVKPNQVSITVDRETRTKDGAGGYTTSSTPITGSPFVGRKIRRDFKGQPNNLQHATPGDMLVTEDVLVFPANSDIRIGDICTVGNVTYKVQYVRNYRRSVQADVKAVS
ncbi:hypothetical protein LLG39_12580 [bacterium]|nr:hypothetical protein [bacterium]